MLNFRPLLPEDTPLLRMYLDRTPDLSCEFSPSCLIMWGQAQIAECEGFLVPLVTYGDFRCYLRPIGGSDFVHILPHLIEDSRERGIPFRMNGITAPVRAYLEQTQNFIYTTNRDYYDYVFRVETLASLSGRKLQAKRNHINRFVSEHPNWISEPITRENLPECRAMTEIWYENHYANGSKPEDFAGERKAIAIAFDNFDTFGFDGLLIRDEGRVIAFSMGMPLNATTFDVNFEKAYAAIDGAYAIINREFSRMVQQKYPHILYLDREDDMGLEGLRKAKLSYNPEILLEKFSALLPEDAQ